MNPYDRTTYDGDVVDWFTRAALEATAKRLGFPLTITQGSYHPGVGASAGTHDGGGVVDLAPWAHVAKVRELRRTGFAAWFRPAIPGLWPNHIHAVLIGNKMLSPAAKAQVVEYLAGFDGLAGSGLDNGPREFVKHRFHWQTGQHRLDRADQLVEKAIAQLATGIRGHHVQPALRRLRAALDAIEKA